MARDSKEGGWYWPKIGNVADAEDASDRGYWAALIVAAITTLFATISLATKADIATISPAAYVDAVLFGIIAWRIKRRSKSFAVAGLCLFIIEKIVQFSMQPQLAIFGFAMAILILLLFITGVRGTFAFHQLSALRAQQRAAQEV
jgi:hypothetical protein